MTSRNETYAHNPCGGDLIRNVFIFCISWKGKEVIFIFTIEGYRSIPSPRNHFSPLLFSFARQSNWIICQKKIENISSTIKYVLSCWIIRSLKTLLGLPNLCRENVKTSTMNGPVWKLNTEHPVRIRMTHESANCDDSRNAQTQKKLVSLRHVN